ncbi:MAG: carbon-nitrogen hydrolase family protein [Saprospiraceae bacterium]|nr:carbon-nitrogen hydrolase family protein [Saprospiraceae bacterium]
MEFKLAQQILGIMFLIILSSIGSIAQEPLNEHDGWKFQSQRDALAPVHAINIQDDGSYSLTLKGDGRAHANGCWVKSFPLGQAKYVRFTVEAHFSGIDQATRSVLSSIVWRNDEGRKISPTEYPALVDLDKLGRLQMRQVYMVPKEATRAEVSLIYRWDADGEVNFAAVSLVPVSSMPERTVQLAAVHHQPRNSTTEKNLKAFGDLAAKAGSMGADIVCLPEGITLVGTGQTYIDVAESLPGPSSKHLGQIARKHQMYIVAGILEREGEVVYNTAILLDRAGELAGKYRKVALPREEIEGGVTPGQEFPVFDTDFGKIGVMICWDVFFPEPARQLALQGAEVIFMPIWGGNINLAKARAIENQVYLVSSTYSMKTGIFDLEGQLMAEGTEEHPISMVEVDLERQKLWPWLGEFKNRIRREMPPKTSLVH